MTEPPVETAKRRPQPRRYRGVDAGERISERRRQFIEAGLECFGTRGYHPVTVRELCAQAHLTERYFYESFKDREALFAAVYEDQIQRLRREFTAAVMPLAPKFEAMARAGLGVYFRNLQQDARVARVLMIDVLTVSADMERRALEATFGFADLLNEMTMALVPRDAKIPADLDLLATGLIGSCVHVAMRWIADGYHQPVDTVIDTSMILFVATVRQLGVAATELRT
ncbi:MAG: TetR/AcrR family transcriptional regulator [Panacagrimonas sp.]|jgi:AcrR family transcriptional regulator|nr:TetR/AcrR family transcriptional regulator [Panacagrimonas sp.]MCC2657742.1 TetR/AcrR family transcriptional regulator [Panacagrimonas sp.]